MMKGSLDVSSEGVVVDPGNGGEITLEPGAPDFPCRGAAR